MAVDKVRLLGDKALREISSKVTSPSAPATRRLCNRLLKIVGSQPGFGISAPQIGINDRVFIMGRPRMPAGKELKQIGKSIRVTPSWDLAFIAVVNPVVTAVSTEVEASYESCLSLPGVAALVPRHTWIEVEFKDLEGTSIKRRLRNHPARVFQHEYDHLEGIMFTDRILDTCDIVAESFVSGFHENGAPVEDLDDPVAAMKAATAGSDYDVPPDVQRESEILAAASRLSTLARRCFGPAGAGEWMGPDANGVKSNCSPTVLARAASRISSGLKLVVNPGEPVLASRALRSELVLDIPLAPAIWNRLAQYQREHSSSAGHVILFSTSLLLSGDEVDVGFALTTESYESSAAANQRSTEWTARDAETKLLAKLADRIVNIPGAEVRYVFSQRLIHPWLRMHLLERGIIAVERVSATHLAAVQELTGAHVFRSAAVLAAGSSALDVTHLGNVGAVEVLRSGSGKRLLRVQAGSRGARVASVVLCAPDEAAADELRVVAQRAIVMLKAFVHNPFALLGAGATELALATRLRQVWAKEAPTAAHASSADILASALESVVRALQPAPVSSGGLTGFDVLDELMDCKNNASKVARGWDPLLERCINPQTVLDSGPAKAHALQVGVQTAIVLFGIGSIIIEDMSSDARPR
ncbi:Peptide deformylase 1B, chloroplastic [Hondaea fermentalgiana]|uniref:Peptide deformylase n=1 Tax=Hondaea fermentalgiana TaxID=2315210 RepID=A0A2R5GNR4_9STRA|nr:Peptide deformylase 1B, chloroplastic [Hondaea fermentalgiana]|eukprot:GBG30263.1 Peptide deformylase 1B, chloroplastic [Hondaea fermentalgiana]